MRVDTSLGFELCPADACALPDAAAASAPAHPKFQIIDGFDPPLLPRYAAFMAANDVHVAGIEFVTDRRGRAWTYDVNTNTNYHTDAERAAGLSGMRALATYLGDELARAYGAADAA